MGILKKIYNSILRFFNSTRYYSKITYVSENPNKKVPYNTLVIVMGNETPKWIKFRCPCGCGSELSIPLMLSYNPHWEITNKDNKITLYPSVNVNRKKSDCGSHFWIKENEVLWV